MLLLWFVLPLACWGAPSLAGTRRTAVVPAPGASRQPEPSPSHGVGEMPTLPEGEPLLPTWNAGPGAFLTLDECLARTWRRHPVLAAQRAVIQQRKALSRQVRALYLPTLGLSAYKEYQDIPGDPLQQAQAIVTLNHTILDSCQRAEKAAAAREATESAVQGLRNTWVTQADQVREAYYGTLLTRWAILIREDDLARNHNSLAVAEGFVRAGLRSAVDLTQARIQVAQSQVGLIKSHTTYQEALLALGRLAAFEPEEIAGRCLVDELQRTQWIPDADEARQRMQSHPSLLAIEHQARAADAQARFFSRTWMPTVTGTAYVGGAGSNYPDSLTWSINFTLQVPFFQPSMQPNVDQQKALARQAREQEGAVRLKLAQVLDTGLSDLRGSEEIIRTGETEVRWALQNYLLASKRYRAGLTGQEDLINARTFLLSARGSYVQGLYTRKIAEARILAVAGMAAKLDTHGDLPHH